MKQKTINGFCLNDKKIHTLIPFLFVLFILISCGGSSTDNTAVDESLPVEVVETESTETTELVSSSGKFFYINNPQNENLAEIVIENNNITLKLPTQRLYGKLKGEKRKYYNGSNQLQNTVKYSSAEKFKLRNQDEQLLWKVKIYDDKIKVSNNEEMESPYEVRLYDGKMKVKRNGEELHVIRFNETDQFVNVGEDYVVRDFRKSFAMGILLIADIPEKERFLLSAELLNQGI